MEDRYYAMINHWGVIVQLSTNRLFQPVNRVDLATASVHRDAVWKILGGDYTQMQKMFTDAESAGKIQSIRRKIRLTQTGVEDWLHQLDLHHQITADEIAHIRSAVAKTQQKT